MSFFILTHLSLPKSTCREEEHSNAYDIIEFFIFSLEIGMDSALQNIYFCYWSFFQKYEAWREVRKNWAVLLINIFEHE